MSLVKVADEADVYIDEAGVLDRVRAAYPLLTDEEANGITTLLLARETVYRSDYPARCFVPKAAPTVVKRQPLSTPRAAVQGELAQGLVQVAVDLVLASSTISWLDLAVHVPVHGDVFHAGLFRCLPYDFAKEFNMSKKFEIDDRMKATLERLQRPLGLASKAAVLRRAVALLTVAAQAEQAHGALCIQHADGTVHTIQL